MIMRRYISMISILSVSIIILVGCGNVSSGRVKSSNIVSLEHSLPQIDGTIVSIQSGKPPHLILKDILEIKNNKMIHIAVAKFNLPAGHFVSPDHWKSNGDTMDLFIGENLNFTINKGKKENLQFQNSLIKTNRWMEFNDHSNQTFAGIVKSINRKEMIIQKVLYDTSSNNSHAMKYTNKFVKIRFAPYTSVSVNGNGGKNPTTVIHVGDPVLFILIGPPSEYIVNQITDFKSISDAAWDMN